MISKQMNEVMYSSKKIIKLTFVFTHVHLIVSSYFVNFPFCKFPIFNSTSHFVSFHCVNVDNFGTTDSIMYTNLDKILQTNQSG